MEIYQLSQEVAVAGQISAADLPAIASAGFKTLICNRPDGESADQPSFASLAEAAASHGLSMHHQPVVSGRITEADVARFRELCDSAEKPLLAFCRSGARCSNLWNMSRAG